MFTKGLVLRTAATVLALTTAALAFQTDIITELKANGTGSGGGEACATICNDVLIDLYNCFSGGKCCGWYNCTTHTIYGGCCYGGQVCDSIVAYPNWGCKAGV
jgi:hypothetical protein